MSDDTENSDNTESKDGSLSDYALARKEWDDRFASQRKAVSFLAVITLVSLGIGLIGTSFAVWTTARTQFVPYIVNVDDLGRIERGQDPQPVTSWPDEVIKRELELITKRMRQVSPDLGIVAENIDALYKFLPANSAASTKLNTYYGDKRNDPRQRAKEETVSIDVLSVNKVTDRTWRIEWEETAYSRTSGRLRDKRRFVATLQTVFRKPGDRVVIKHNPLGLFVEDIDIQEVRL
jgi:type IV secretion system protein VirB5